jgi:hypothetical protein
MAIAVTVVIVLPGRLRYRSMAPIAILQPPTTVQLVPDQVPYLVQSYGIIYLLAVGLSKIHIFFRFSQLHPFEDEFSRHGMLEVSATPEAMPPCMSSLQALIQSFESDWSC